MSLGLDIWRHLKRHKVVPPQPLQVRGNWIRFIGGDSGPPKYIPEAFGNSVFVEYGAEYVALWRKATLVTAFEELKAMGEAVQEQNHRQIWQAYWALVLLSQLDGMYARAQSRKQGISEFGGSQLSEAGQAAKVDAARAAELEDELAELRERQRGPQSQSNDNRARDRERRGTNDRGRQHSNERSRSREHHNDTGIWGSDEKTGQFFDTFNKKPGFRARYTSSEVAKHMTLLQSGMYILICSSLCFLCHLLSCLCHYWSHACEVE